MTNKNGVRGILSGTIIEAIGLFLDVLHHLNIGINTPEGLLTPIHATIFIGFLINTIGVIIILKKSVS